MYCRNCGSEINGNKPFCSKCGSRNESNDTYNQEYYVESSNASNGLSITGMILGLIAAVLSIVLVILISNERYLNDKYLALFFVLGLLSGIFFLVGLILSIVGTSKKVNPMGIVGIIASILSFAIDMGVVIYFFSLVS